MDDSGTTRRPMRVRRRRRMRPQPRRRRLPEAAEPITDPPADVAEAGAADGRGPYEDRYDVRRGYAIERVIVRP